MFATLSNKLEFVDTITSSYVLLLQNDLRIINIIESWLKAVIFYLKNNLVLK